MILRLARAIQAIITSYIFSDSEATLATVTSGVTSLPIPGTESRPKDQATDNNGESQRRRLRSGQRPRLDSPMVLGNEFWFMNNITSPMEPLVNMRALQENIYSAKDKTCTDATKVNASFFIAVEDYRSGGIFLPTTPSLNGTPGENNFGGIAHSYESAQLKLQVSNLAEERDTIISELSKQAANFEQIIAYLTKQRNELTKENEALKLSLSELGSKLETKDASVQHLLSEHKRLNDLISHAHLINAQHQLESETLHRTVATLKQEKHAILRNNNATIEELKDKCDELNKKVISLNAAHLEETRRVDKNKHNREGLFDMPKLTEADTSFRKLESPEIEFANTFERSSKKRKDTEIEHEIGVEVSEAKINGAIYDYKKRVEDMEKKNTDLEKEIQKLRASLRDRKLNAGERFNENQETIVESERGRPGFPNKVIRRFSLKILARSLSRPRTPEADEQRVEKQFEEYGSVKEVPGSPLFSPPGSIASVSSTSTLNNDDNEVSVVGDDGVKGSPEHLKLLIPLSPTPLKATDRGSRSPLSPFFTGRLTPGATDSYPIQRTQSPLSTSAPWRATSPAHQSPSSQSKKLKDTVKIESWYHEEVDSTGDR